MKQLALALGLLAAPLPANSGVIGPYSDLLVFGDSFSDAGRAFSELDASLLPPPSLYPEGQLTNGQTWAALLGADKPLVNNFAFAGAKATTNADAAPDFAAQRQDFRDRLEGGLDLGPRPLTAVFFGGNDLVSAFRAPNPLAVGMTAVQDIISGTADLIGLGLVDALVLGLPNLGRIPEVRAAGDIVAGFATFATREFNEAIQAGVAALASSTGANVRYFDTFGAIEQIFSDAEARGLNGDIPCLSLFPECGPDTFGKYIFYDGIHPTAEIHAAFAEAVRNEIAPIPLPAGGLLLLTGLGALVLGRRLALADGEKSPFKSL